MVLSVPMFKHVRVHMYFPLSGWPGHSDIFLGNLNFLFAQKTVQVYREHRRISAICSRISVLDR